MKDTYAQYCTKYDDVSTLLEQVSYVTATPVKHVCMLILPITMRVIFLTSY